VLPKVLQNLLPIFSKMCQLSCFQMPVVNKLLKMQPQKVRLMFNEVLLLLLPKVLLNVHQHWMLWRPQVRT
jgi:hypothetical protein